MALPALARRHRCWLLGALFLVSCSSLHRQAREHAKTGSYDEAVALYDRILVEDPKDAEAIAERAKVREKVIDQKLLVVRRSRLGGNAQNALDLLLDVVTKENDWHTFPGGAVAYTQDEESREALPYLGHQVRTAIDKKLPLRAHVLLTRYAPIFAGPLAGAFERLTADTKKAGVKSCERFAPGMSAEAPYYSGLVNRYCALWGSRAELPAGTTEKRLAELYKGLAAKVAIHGTSDDIALLFVDSMETEFKKTPWFDPRAGRELGVSLRGSYVADVQERTEERVHEYTVQIPYTDYERVMKTRQVAYTETSQSCHYDSYTGQQVCYDAPVTRYRPESYWETEPVTRYRTEPRVQPYSGTAISQHLALALDGTARFAAGARRLALTEKNVTAGFTHEWNLPAIGLYPEQAQLTDPLHWIKEQAGGAGAAMLKQANDQWEQQYCRPLANRGAALQGDQVQRCFRRNPTPMPDFVAKWFQQNLGVTAEEANAALGLREL